MERGKWAVFADLGDRPFMLGMWNYVADQNPVNVRGHHRARRARIKKTVKESSF